MNKTLVFVIWLYILPFFAVANFSSKKDTTKVNYKFLIISSSVYSASITGLSYVWYNKYQHTGFHFFNDGSEWLQMDKVGHGFSAYYINSILCKQLNSNKLWYSYVITQIYMSGIEIMDAYQKDWGFSWWDIAANNMGSALFSLQQRYQLPIKLKFSYYPTQYSPMRPEMLGSTFIENILKDYNGQTYWLAISPWSKSIFTLDIGYSATGMLGGKNNPPEFASIPRYRQFYLSAGITLSKIKTKKKWLKVLLNTIDVIKIPFPSLYIESSGKVGVRIFNL